MEYHHGLAESMMSNPVVRPYIDEMIGLLRKRIDKLSYSDASLYLFGLEAFVFKKLEEDLDEYEKAFEGSFLSKLFKLPSMIKYKLSMLEKLAVALTSRVLIGTFQYGIDSMKKLTEKKLLEKLRKISINGSVLGVYTPEEALYYLSYVDGQESCEQIKVVKSEEDVRRLRQERDYLLERLSAMEDDVKDLVVCKVIDCIDEKRMKERYNRILERVLEAVNPIKLFMMLLILKDKLKKGTFSKDVEMILVKYDQSSQNDAYSLDLDEIDLFHPLLLPASNYQEE